MPKSAAYPIQVLQVRRKLGVLWDSCASRGRPEGFKRGRLLAIVVLTWMIGVSAGLLSHLSAQALKPWERPPDGWVARTLWEHYSRSTGRPAGITGCDATNGEPCFGMDHEDQKCRRPGGCRSPSEVSQFLDRLVRSLERDPSLQNRAQVVYALTRFERFLTATEVLGECGEGAWWCELLLGSVLYHSGQTVRAGEYLESGLDGADERLACRLESVELLLHANDIDPYRKMGCVGRGEFHARFWWLADPLHSVSGNERWAEHVVRRFELFLHERLLESWDETHPESHEWNVVRRGFEDSWSVQPPPFHRWTSKPVAVNSFVPRTPVAADLVSVSYDLEAALSDEGFTSKHGVFSTLDLQVARFWNGDSVVMGAASDGLAGESESEDSLTLSAVISHRPKDSPILLGPATRRHRVVFRRTLGAFPVLLSFEGVVGDQAARKRIGVGHLSEGLLRLSDPLLFELRGSTLPENRSAAIAAMLGRSSVSRDEVLGIYVEAASPAEGTPMNVSVRLESGERGVIPRLLNILGAGGEPRFGSGISWSEVSGQPPHAIVFTLDVGALEPGDYTLIVEIEAAESTSESVSRQVHIR